jgi:hypothetical protein
VIEGFCSAEVKLFGPVQEYVAPETKFDVRFKVLPVQTGELLDTVGAEGGVFTVHTTVPIELVQPLTVIANEYVPAAAAVAPGIVGFCNAEVKPLGPVHEYVAPMTAVVVRFRVCPTQIGELLVGAGVAGTGFTVTATVPKALGHPAIVAVTEYVPLAAVVALTILGF